MLNQRQQDGATLRDHLEARARLRGGDEAKAQLHVPEPPRGFHYLLEDFDVLHRRRQYGPHGALPIPWSEVDRYAERHGLTGWERRVLTRLDDASFATEPDVPKTDVPVVRDDPAWPTKKVS